AKGGQEFKNTPLEADPVSMISGEEMLQLNDATLPGPMPFTFKRTSRRSNPRDSGLGVARTHSDSDSLQEGDHQVAYLHSEGRSLPFAVPRNQQRSKYTPEQLNLDREDSTTFILKTHGEWDKVFTRVNPHSKHYRLTQLRHTSYIPPQTVLGVASSESGFC